MAAGTGMAVVLLLLLLALVRSSWSAVQLSAAVLVLTMLVPSAFCYPALLWYGLGRLLGVVTSCTVLGVLFLAVVTTLGWLRRIGGADPLLRKRWRGGTESVFRVRERTFGVSDLTKPY
jgi:hypothetical protein